MGIVGTHPGSFRKSGKQRGYGIRNLEEGTEDGRRGEMMEGKSRRDQRRGTPTGSGQAPRAERDAPGRLGGYSVES